MTSSCRKVCLIGGSGMVGRAFLTVAGHAPDIEVTALVRNRPQLSVASSVRFAVEPVGVWPRTIEGLGADVIISTLGTTRKAAGSADAFKAVDHDLVLSAARAAKAGGASHMIVVSSVGADAGSSKLYLRTKGELERDLADVGFDRIDVLRPGLLTGRRAESRPLEALGRMAAPLVDAVLLGHLRRYRSISADTIAQALVALVRSDGQGFTVHHFDEIGHLAALRHG